MTGDRDPLPLPRFASIDAKSAFGAPAGPFSELAEVALEAARAAATIQWRAANSPESAEGVRTKSSATDMVSDVDRDCEAAVSTYLAGARPDDGLLGEEGTSRPGTTGIRWVVDPLDGTTNFLFGIPQFSVSVAAESDGETVIGVVIDPSRDETWAAVRGGGSLLNGAPCRVAHGRSTLATALVATGFGYRAERRRWQAEVAAKIIPSVRDIRRFGSAALDLCWMGGGRFDAYYEWGLNPWDLAAGSLVASEAGARVGILEGRLVVAAVPELWDDLTGLLASSGGLDAPSGPEPAFWE